MNIVFLDAATVDFGDMDFSPLCEAGGLTVYPLTGADEFAERMKDADVAIANKVAFSRERLALCPRLKLIAVAATGYNNVDLDAAREKGVAVANVPGYSTASVAQHTFALILALASSLEEYNAAAHDGRWSRSPMFTMGDWPFVDLKGRILGILGAGAIGSEVARIGRAFGMRSVALKRTGVRYGDDIERFGLNELAAMSDFVTLHMPLTPETRHIADMEFFGRMKKTAFLVNMARGPLVDPNALCSALISGEIAGAAIDVMEKEPPDKDDPLLRAPRLIITPHIAWASLDSRTRLIREIAENIAAFSREEKRNIVT